MKIALLGYGTIGRAVMEVLETNRTLVAKRAGEELSVKYVLDLRDFPGDPVAEKIVHDYQIIVTDPEVEIVVEAMGGVEPAFTFTRDALLAGKSVVTSNKALVAKHGAALLALAKEKGLHFLFEASVGGGIPIIRPMNTSLTSEDIESVTGILNGTTNFMLTKMEEEGSDFEAVLKEAQRLGYAEADPTADIEGFDACRKIAILTSLAYGKFVDFEEIHTEGITKITATDMAYAKKLGYGIKLLAGSTKTEDGVVALVAPRFVPVSSPLYGIKDVFNGILVHGNMLADAMFYGSGAGKPTASAVVSDLVDIVRNPGHTLMEGWTEEKLELLDYKTLSHRFFLRTKASEEEIQKAFGKVTLVRLPELEEVGFITEEMKECQLEEKASSFELLQCIRVF